MPSPIADAGGGVHAVTSQCSSADFVKCLAFVKHEIHISKSMFILVLYPVTVILTVFTSLLVLYSLDVYNPLSVKLDELVQERCASYDHRLQLYIDQDYSLRQQWVRTACILLS